jgi:hypothetical protein
MFQFPLNPAVGQLYAPAAGISYRFNGTAWYLVNTQTMTPAEADLRYFQKTLAVNTIDGTLAAPALAFASEPGLGLYRSAAGQMSFAVGGVNKVAINATGFTVALPIISTIGQIAFPAAQNPSVAANTLDDYREGTYNPVDNSSGGLVLAITLVYTKIGRMVFCAVGGSYPNTADANFAKFSLPFIAATNGSGAMFHGGSAVADKFIVEAGDPTNCSLFKGGARARNSEMSFSTLTGSFTYQATA